MTMPRVEPGDTIQILSRAQFTTAMRVTDAAVILRDGTMVPLDDVQIEHPVARTGAVLLALAHANIPVAASETPGFLVHYRRSDDTLVLRWEGGATPSQRVSMVRAVAALRASGHDATQDTQADVPAILVPRKPL